MKKLILFIVLIGTIFLAYKFYENMEVTDRDTYEKDYDKFVKLNYEVTGFYMLDGDFYSVVEYQYNNTKKYKFPTHKKEYLEDKLKYYEEKSYHDRDYYKKLTSYVNAELEQTKESDLIKPNKFFMKSMDIYCKRVERLLPLYNKMERFFAFKFVEDKEDSVTHAYHSRLKEAIRDLQTLKALQKSLPKLPYLFYVLDGGHGKEIPLDDYEIEIQHKQSKLEKDFTLYVPKGIQKKCDGLDDICKTFYTGYYLLDYRYKASLSLKYLVESYEKNASKVVEHMEAKDYYLSETIARLYEGTGHYDSATKFYKLSIQAGNERAVCYEGSVYMKQEHIKKAFRALEDGASKHYVECYLDLGRYYFNDEFGVKNKELGGEYWKLAYEDSSYGIAENYNMGVYSEYKRDDVKNRYYTLKAAKMGDKDALRYLSSHLKNISTTKLFLEEALGSHFWNVRERNNREFSHNYDLYYRLKKMFNHDASWVEDHDYEDKRWAENQDNVVKFDKRLSSLVFESNKIILQTKVTSRNRDEIFSKDIELLYKLLFVDLSGAKNVVNLHHELIGRVIQKKSFEYSREFSVDGYGFVWYGKYDVQSKELILKIQIDER